jgi:prophage regulatory protein
VTPATRPRSIDPSPNQTTTGAYGVEDVQEVSSHQPPAQRETLLRLEQVEAATGLKKSTIYGLMKAGKFVRPVRITARCTAWPASQVEAWVQARIAESAGTAT